VCVCVKTRFSLSLSLCRSPSLAIVLWATAAYMIIKWIREFHGHGRQEKRIYSGDAYNATSSVVWCASARCSSVVFFSFLIYFSAVICLSHAVRPHNIIPLYCGIVRKPRCVTCAGLIPSSYLFFFFFFLFLLRFYPSHYVCSDFGSSAVTVTHNDRKHRM